MAVAVQHPYVPRDIHLPDFVPPALTIIDLLIPYAVSSLVGAALVWILSGRTSKLSKTDRILMCWWLFTGMTHMVLEGYFVFSPEFYKKKSPFYLAEIWKEYSKGDSRYASRNSAIVSVEGVTAVLEGPASILALYAIWKKKPYSYLLQLSVSLGQLYGCLVYFATALLDGDNFAASSHHYWAYFIVANSFWIYIPMIIATRSWKKISTAVSSYEKKSKSS